MGTEDDHHSAKKEVSSEIIAPCSTANVDEQILAADWDPLFSMDYGSSAAFPSYIAGSQKFHGIENNSGRNGIMQTDIGMLRVPVPQISSVSQVPSFWDHDLQNIITIGFIPNPPMNNNKESNS